MEAPREWAERSGNYLRACALGVSGALGLRVRGAPARVHGRPEGTHGGVLGRGGAAAQGCSRDLQAGTLELRSPRPAARWSGSGCAGLGMNLEGGGRGADFGMSAVSCGNGKLRQWLIDQIDSGKYPGLVWENEEKSIFRIPWKHAGKQDYNREEDAALFKVAGAGGRDGGGEPAGAESPMAAAGGEAGEVPSSGPLREGARVRRA